MKAEQARAGEANPRATGPGGDDSASRDRATGKVPAPGVALEPLLQAISDGIVATDAGGRILFANPAAAAAYGVPAPADLVGRSMAEIAARVELADEAGAPLTPDDLPGARALAGQGGERLVRFRGAGSTAEPRWALVKGTPTFGSGGAVELAIQVIRDVTEREQERQRQRAENARLMADAQGALRSREDLLAIVSHDLRNPLGVVLTSSTLLLRSALPPDKDERARRQVEAIQRAGNRMNRLIRDLLDFASIEGGRLTLARRPLDVAALISEVVQALCPLAAPRSQQLTGEDTVPGLAIDGDHDRLVQVFTHVVGNSFKFGPDGGQVRIAADRQGSQVRFVVADDGPGMPPDELANLFDRIWQAGRKSRDGIGLGLSIVKGIVEAHGGRVWAESAVGEGTKVFFTVPAASG
ncbi:MAG TPA: ATP-binding protein [Polyangia bacterium]|nr:ATP-binding protein [Polyangia bacterium]